MANLEQAYTNQQQSALNEMHNAYTNFMKNAADPTQTGTYIENPMARASAGSSILKTIGNEANYYGSAANNFAKIRIQNEKAAASAAKSAGRINKNQIGDAVTGAISGINDPVTLEVFKTLDPAFQKKWISDYQNGVQGPGLARTGATADDVINAYQLWQKSNFQQAQAKTNSAAAKTKTQQDQINQALSKAPQKNVQWWNPFSWF